MPIFPKASEFIEFCPSAIYSVPRTRWLLRKYYDAIDVYWDDGRLCMGMTFELSQEFSGAHFTEENFAKMEKWLQEKWGKG
jgi:hypothetical protein